MRNLASWLYLGTTAWELEHESEREVGSTLDIFLKLFNL